MSWPHWFLLMLVNVIWGFNFVATKVSLEDFPPLLATALRFLLLLIFLFPFIKMPRVHVSRTLWAAGLSVGHFVLLNVALWLTGGIGSIAVVLLLNIPIATLFAVVFLGERIGLKSLIGISISFFGVLILAWRGEVSGDLLAIVAALGSATVYAAMTIVVRRMQDIHPFTVQAWVGVLGVPVLLLLSFLTEDMNWTTISNAGALAWGGVWFGALLSSIVGHGSIYWLLQRYPVSTIAPFTLLTQVFALAFGVMIFDEVLDMRLIIGAALTLIGVTIITLRARAKATSTMVNPSS